MKPHPGAHRAGLACLLLASILIVPLSSPCHAAPAATSRDVLIIGQGPDGHPAGTHEFMAGARVVEALLLDVEGIRTTVTKADEPWSDGPALLEKADTAVLLVTQGARWMQQVPERFAAFKSFAQRKGALVALHWSIGAHDAQYIPGQLALLGGTRGGPQRKYQILEADVHRAAPKHPILTGIPDFRIRDEFYYRLDLLPTDPGFRALLTARIDGAEEIVSWAWERPDGGRSFGYVGIHFHANWEREEYRRLVKQAILWTLDRPIQESGADVSVAPEVLKLAASQP